MRTSLASTAFAMAMTVSLAMFNLICCLFNCQTSYMDMNGVPVPPNYHTFKGEAYQGRYVSGIVAGMKISEMIA